MKYRSNLLHLARHGLAGAFLGAVVLSPPLVYSAAYDYKIIPGSNCRATEGDPLVRTPTSVFSTGMTEVACPLERDGKSTYTLFDFFVWIHGAPDCVLWSCNNTGMVCQTMVNYWLTPGQWVWAYYPLSGRWTTATEVFHCQLEGSEEIDRIMYAEIDP